MTKTIRCTLAVLALAATSGAAQANVIADWGNIAAPGATFDLGHSFSSPTSFSDDYLFSLSGTGSSSGDVDTFDGWLNLLDIDLDSVKLFKNGGLVGSDSNPTNGFSFGSLGAGSYVLQLNGDVSRTFGILPSNVGYDGSVSISSKGAAASVPEPGTFALLGAGLLGLAFMRRRIGAR